MGECRKALVDTDVETVLGLLVVGAAIPLVVSGAMASEDTNSSITAFSNSKPWFSIEHVSIFGWKGERRMFRPRLVCVVNLKSPECFYFVFLGTSRAKLAWA